MWAATLPESTRTAYVRSAKASRKFASDLAHGVVPRGTLSGTTVAQSDARGTVMGAAIGDAWRLADAIRSDHELATLQYRGSQERIRQAQADLALEAAKASRKVRSGLAHYRGMATLPVISERSARGQAKRAELRIEQLPTQAPYVAAIARYASQEALRTSATTMRRADAGALLDARKGTRVIKRIPVSGSDVPEIVSALGGVRRDLLPPSAAALREAALERAVDALPISVTLASAVSDTESRRVARLKARYASKKRAKARKV